MMKFAKLMLKIRKKYDNDSHTSRVLGVSRQSVFNISDGINIPKDSTIERMAMELDMEVEPLLIQAKIERSTGSAKSAWEKIAKKYEGIAATVLTLITLPYFVNNGIQCILCQIANYKESTTLRHS